MSGKKVNVASIPKILLPKCDTYREEKRLTRTKAPAGKSTLKRSSTETKGIYKQTAPFSSEIYSETVGSALQTDVIKYRHNKPISLTEIQSFALDSITYTNQVDYSLTRIKLQTKKTFVS